MQLLVLFTTTGMGWLIGWLATTPPHQWIGALIGFIVGLVVLGCLHATMDVDHVLDVIDSDND